MTGPGWLRWITRASVVLGIGALVATVWLVGIDTITERLRAIGGWFVVLLAIEGVATCCDAAAVYLVTRGNGAPSYRKVLVAQFAGRAVNSVTPAGNLGEALKVTLLARTCSPRRIVAAVMYVALTALVVALAMIALGTGMTAFLFHIPALAMFAMLAAAALAGGVALAIIVLVRRGMLSTLSNAAARLHLISRARRKRWTNSLEDLDARLRGDIGAGHRAGATAFVVASQLLQKTMIYIAIVASGFELSFAQVISVLSAGILIAWIATIVPMGLGVSEGGHMALFALIGAPAALGVAIALARRVNQIVFAMIGFAVLGGDRLVSRVGTELTQPRLPSLAHP